MRKLKFARGGVLVALAVMGALLPVADAVAAPSIQFLNPSGYSPTLRLSTKDDGSGDNGYHLVAWVGEVPTNPLVEFEVAATPGIPGQGGNEPTLATVTATRVGTDTFEGTLSSAGIPDGQYFLRAILYANFVGPGTGEEVARAQESVTIQSNQTTAANTVEMDYPLSGGPLGFWRTGDRAPVAVVTGQTSAGTNQVRVLYTTTRPGNEPDWEQCGTGGASNRQFRIRCTLAGTDGSAAVTAVAAVANTAPSPAPPQESSDESGDAHRVAPYVQSPSSVIMTPASAQVNPNDCTLVTATVLDQSGVPVATLNVDVHAQGPDDQLRFATQQVNGANRHSAFQAPDAAHTGNESTAKCGATDPDGRQGDHNVAGAADFKHIESTPTGGTNNGGEFTFILRSGTGGGTQITVWGDENDDDSLNTNEASGTGQLGWGQAPPPPATILNMDPSSLSARRGECERMVVTATQNGAAQAGLNVDIHITGPAGVSFCSTGDSGTSAPDAGNHAGDVDTGQENTRHAEGSTNSSGQLIFGVTSATSGKTDVVSWIDEDQNDLQGNQESTAAGTIEWQEQGERDISLSARKKRVRKGGRARLFGDIDSAGACVSRQRVNIQKKKQRGGFKTVDNVRTDNDGDFEAKIRIRKATTFRAVAPQSGACENATSNRVRVRTR